MERRKGAEQDRASHEKQVIAENDVGISCAATDIEGAAARNASQVTKYK